MKTKLKSGVKYYDRVRIGLKMSMKLKTWYPVKRDLTVDDQVTLLTRLVEKDYVFRWLKLISHLLPDLFSKDYSFVTLLETIIDKIKGDMAQGDFIRSLIKLVKNTQRKVLNFIPFWLMFLMI